MTICKYCQKEFIPHKLHPYAKRCSTIKCHSAYKKEWDHNNRELSAEYKKQYILRNPEKRRNTHILNFVKPVRKYFTQQEGTTIIVTLV